MTYLFIIITMKTIYYLLRKLFITIFQGQRLNYSLCHIYMWNVFLISKIHLQKILLFYFYLCLECDENDDYDDKRNEYDDSNDDNEKDDDD